MTIDEFLIQVVDAGHTYQAVLMTGTGMKSNIKASSTAGYSDAASALVRKLKRPGDELPVGYELKEKSVFKKMRYFTLTMIEGQP